MFTCTICILCFALLSTINAVNLTAFVNELVESYETSSVKFVFQEDGEKTLEFYVRDCPVYPGVISWSQHRPLILKIWHDYNDQDNEIYFKWRIRSSGGILINTNQTLESNKIFGLSPFALISGYYNIELKVTKLNPHSIFKSKWQTVCNIHVEEWSLENNEKHPDSRAMLIPNNSEESNSSFLHTEYLMSEEEQLLHRTDRKATLKISCVKNCIPVSPIVNHRLSVRLEAVHGNTSEIKPNKIQWSVYKTENGTITSMEKLNQTGIMIFKSNGNEFNIREYVLQPDSSYIIMVKLEGEDTVLATTYVKTSQLPKVPKCSVDYGKIPNLGKLICDMVPSDNRYLYELRTEDSLISGFTLSRGFNLNMLQFPLPSSAEGVWLFVIDKFDVYDSIFIKVSGIADLKEPNITHRQDSYLHLRTLKDTFISLNRKKIHRLISLHITEVICPLFFVITSIDYANSEKDFKMVQHEVISVLNQYHLESLDDTIMIAAYFDRTLSLKLPESLEPHWLVEMGQLGTKLASKQFVMIQNEPFPTVMSEKVEAISKKLLKLSNDFEMMILNFVSIHRFKNPIVIDDVYREWISESNYKLVERLSENLVNMRQLINKALMFVLTDEEETYLTSSSYNVLIRKDTGTSLSRSRLRVGNAYFVLPEDMVNISSKYQLAAYEGHPIIVEAFEEDGNTFSNILSVNLTDEGSNKTQISLNAPFNVIFDTKMELDGFKIRQHVQTIRFHLPEDIYTYNRYVINNLIESFYVDLMSYQTMVLAFADLQPTDSFDVVLHEHNTPNIEHFAKNVTISYNSTKQLSYRNENNHMTRLYVGILPNRIMLNNSSKEYKDFLLNLTFGVATCYSWNDTSSTWEYACKSTVETSLEALHCRCDGFPGLTRSTFGFLSVQDQKGSHIANTAASNGMLMIFLSVIIMIFLTAMLFGLGQRKNEIFYLSDNLWCDRYAYMINVKTGFSRGAGTTSNITVKLRGSAASSRPHVLNFPDPESLLLQRHNSDYFILTTEQHLGDIDAIEIWHDSVGFSPTWDCVYVAILDLQLNDQYYFRVNKSFRVTQKDSNYLLVKITSKKAVKEAESRMQIMSELSELTIDWYKNITIAVSTCLFTAVTAMFISAYPTWDAKLAFVDFANHGYKITHTLAFLCSAILSLIVHMSIAYLFRNSARQFTDRTVVATQYSFKITVFCWTVLIIIISLCILYVVFFDSWLPITNAFWLCGILVALIMEFLISIRAYVILGSCFKACSSETTQESGETALLEQAESQRDYIHYRFGGMGLRPYMNHLYTPATEKSISIKKMHDEIIGKLFELFEDGMMFLVYLIVLHHILYAERDPAKSLSVKIWNDKLSLGADEHDQTLTVKSHKEIYDFLNDTLMESMFAVYWYDVHEVRHPFISDYRNFLLIAPRIRILKVKPKSCTLLKQMRYLKAGGCSANFDLSLNDKDYYMAYWKKGSVNRRPSGMWVYESPMLTGSSFTTGFAGYPGGGYVVEIRPDRQSAMDMIKYLRAKHWLDFTMRFFILEILMYNVDSNLFTIIELRIERSATGYFITELNVAARRWIFANSEIKIIWLIIFAIIVAWLALLTFKKLSGLTRSLATFLKDVCNAVDFTIILMGVICTTMMILRLQMVEEFVMEIKQSNYGKFIPYYHLLRLENIVKALSMLVIMCVTLRLWKLMRFGRVFKIMETTLCISALPLLCGALCHILIAAAFAFLGMSLFAAVSADFQGSFGNTITTMLLLSVKLSPRFDYDMFSESNLGIGYIFITMFLIYMLILYNVYKTIVIMSYSKAKQHFSNELAMEYTTKDYIKDRFMRLFRKKARLKAGGAIKQKVFPKADEFRFSNGYFVPTSHMHRMTYITLCFLENKLEVKNNDGTLSSDNMALVKRLVDNVYGQKQSKDTKELFYKGQMIGESISFIDETRILQIEAAVNAMLLNREEKKIILNKERFYDRKVQRGIKHIRYIGDSLKDVMSILNSIEVGKYHL